MSARQPRGLRREFTKGLRARIETLQHLIPRGSPSKRREKALASMASLVGAVILSRAVDDATLAHEILEAVTKQCEAI